MTAILLISHGSRYPSTVEEIQRFVEKLREKSGLPVIEYAFLEIASPSIPEGIENCIQKGADEVILLLNFLNSGKHVDEDIPRIVAEARAKHPGVSIKMTKPIGTYDQIIDLFLGMIDSSRKD